MTQVIQSRPPPASVRIGRFAAVASLLFTIGTVLHGFVVIDTATIEEVMRRAGSESYAADAPGFTAGFRWVGAAYAVGNALGVMAWWRRPAWLFWVVLAVNATQACGWVAIPSEMWTVVRERGGVWALLPSVVTDGGAVIITAVLLATLIRYRRPWGRGSGAR